MAAKQAVASHCYTYELLLGESLAQFVNHSTQSLLN